ncbi:MAG: carboxypeptidase regulatory-like domain-containing protein, partial [Verrucomicrobiota bacterium]
MKGLFFSLLVLLTCTVVFAQEEEAADAEAGAAPSEPTETLGVVTATAEAPEEVPEQEIPEVRAGEGVLVGVVFDGKSGNPLGGVAVILTGADKQTITNDRGEFKIEGIIPGKYEVILTQGGFEITSLKEFVVQNGKITLLRKGLEPKPVEGDDEVFKLEAVEVVAELVEDGAESLLFDRKEFAQLTNAIGSEDFSKQDLGDAAAAMSRVAAVNVVDGKYAVIRGLGDRYSNTTLNGALIPSADPSKKAVQLDLIPTHLLRSILTFKQFTPDLWAEFAGGSVDLQTLQFPKELLIKFSAGMGFSENATGKEIAVNPDRRLGFFGANDSLPSISNIREFPGGVRRGSDPPSEAQLEADREWTKLHLNGGMIPDTRTAGINTSLSLTLGNTFEWGDGSKLGMVFAFNQGRDYDYIEGREINRGSNNQGAFDVRQSQIQDISTTAIDWGALLNLSFAPVEDHSVSLTIMSNNAAEDQVRQGRFLVDDESGTIVNPRDGNPGGIETVLGKTARVYSSFDEIAYLERSLNALQFQGNHHLDYHNGIDIDWILSFSTAEEDRPDQRHLKSFQLDYADPTLADVPRINPATLDPSLGTIFTSGNPLGGNPSNSFREYLNTYERATNAGGTSYCPAGAAKWLRGQKA